MRDGSYTIYSIQHRETHTNEWLKPDTPLLPVKKDPDWGHSGTDYWGHSTDPHIGTGNDWRAKNEAAHEELFRNKMDTGYCGWDTLKYAKAALKRLRRDDDKGMYDSRDGYGTYHQSCRHEFRIILISMMKKTTILDNIGVESHQEIVTGRRV